MLLCGDVLLSWTRARVIFKHNFNFSSLGLQTFVTGSPCIAQAGGGLAAPPQPPPVLARRGLVPLDWLSIEGFLTCVVPGPSTVWPTSLWLHSSRILLLAGHKLLKVCQGLLHPAGGPGLCVMFSHWPSLGTALFVQVMSTKVSPCFFFFFF